MSKFLAPIHFWLYRKIEIQEQLIDNILEKSNTDKKDFYEKLGALPQGSLENNIDTNNIHGWLQKNIIESETRLANSVRIAIDNGISEDELKELFYEEGKSIGESISPQDAYQKVNDSLLDGMPCDNVNILVSQSDQEVIWKRTADLHGEYFEEQNLDKDLYYELRDWFLKGIAGDNISFTRNEEEYIFSNKAQ